MEVLPDELGLVVVLPVLGLVVVLPLEAPGSVVFDDVLVLPLVVGLVDVLVLPLVVGLRMPLVSRIRDVSLRGDVYDEVSARPVCMRVVSLRLPITVSDRPGFPETVWSSLLRAHAAPASTASDNAAIIAFLQSLPPM